MTNPYEAPRSAIVEPAPARRFRWRVIPAAILILFGSFLLMTGAFSVGLLILKGGSFPNGVRPSWAEGVALMALAGGFWILGGAWYWKQKWWRATLALLLGYGAGVWSAYLVGRR